MAAAEGTASVPLPVEASDFRWRSLQWFNLYRLAVASFFLASVFIYQGRSGLGSQAPGLFLGTSTIYLILAVAFLGTQDRLRERGNLYVSVTVLTDILCLSLLMYANGGYRSGITFLILVALAGAALVGQGRLIFFYAAVGAIALLLEQSYRVLSMAGDAGEFTQVGFTSIGFFAITLLMRFLARRVLENEILARQRGIDLAKQERVNELVIRDMQDGVLVVGEGGRVRQCNPQARRLLGVHQDADGILAHYSPELALCVAGIGEDLPGSSHPFRNAVNGRSLLARFAAAGSGDVIIYLEDQDRIQSRAEQVKLAALGRLTAGIAHEIRNPLSAIGHAAELLREEKDNRTQSRLTRIINDNVRRMEAMVRDVLELGRRDRARPETIWLASFLAAFVEELCSRENVAPGTVRVNVAPDVVLQFDRAHLNQVLWNLLRNALRHSSRGPGALRLFVPELRVDEDAAPELHVVDDGKGIDAGLREQIFEPFFTTDSRGTGLGLYIARELCEANGATLELAENAPGAHFVITGKRMEA